MNNNSVPCGSGHPLIRLQALGAGRYPLLSLTQNTRPGDSPGHRFARPPSLRLRRKEGGRKNQKRAVACQLDGFGRKQVKQWWPCAAAGLSGMLPEALELCDKRRQQAPAQVLPALQRNGPERKRSIPDDLIFGYFSSKEK